MLRTSLADPLEDEALETRAWSHFDTAREQGSHMTDDELIRHCRQLAQQEVLSLQVLGDEPAEVLSADGEADL
jgi:hypothetical protein